MVIYQNENIHVADDEKPMAVVFLEENVSRIDVEYDVVQGKNVLRVVYKTGKYMSGVINGDA
jgi:hypothetical protein